MILGNSLKIDHLNWTQNEYGCGEHSYTDGNGGNTSHDYQIDRLFTGLLVGDGKGAGYAAHNGDGVGCGEDFDDGTHFKEHPSDW